MFYILVGIAAAGIVLGFIIGKWYTIINIFNDYRKRDIREREEMIGWLDEGAGHIQEIVDILGR